MSAKSFFHVPMRSPKWLLGFIALGLLLSTVCMAATARAAPGDFAVSSTTLDFGNVGVGTSATLAVTITNVSQIAQMPALSGGGLSDRTYFDGNQTCGARTLQPGESCALNYIFHPGTLGAHANGTSFNVGSTSYTVSLSGIGILPLTVSPTALDFGNVAIGTSASLDVIVKNVSNAVQTPTYSGGGVFDKTNFGGGQNCAGKPLQPGDSCVFTYTFHPATVGAKSERTSIGIIGTSYPNSTSYSITLSGTGILPFSVSPTSLDFGNVLVGSSTSLNVTIKNVSNAVQKPAFSGGGVADTANFNGGQSCAGRTFQPGDSCVFIYTFHPTTVGPKSDGTSIGIGNDSYAIRVFGTGIGTAKYRVGGTLSGLVGSGLVLNLNSGVQTLPIAANGKFAFPTALADGSAYAVSVSIQPSAPTQVCSVTNGAGNLNGADVTGIVVECTPPAVNGVCGSDNGSTLSVTPTHLCSAGTASAVSGSGPWSWNCAGDHGGSTATCSANASAGKLQLSGNGNAIGNGAATPSVSNGTDFGHLQAGAQATHSFSIGNIASVSPAATGKPQASTDNLAPQAAGDLVVSSISSDNAAFVIGNVPRTIARGANAAFTLSYQPSAIGAHNATITIRSNDPSAPSFTFVVTGQAIAAPPVTPAAPAPALSVWALFLLAGMLGLAAWLGLRKIGTAA